MHAARYVRHSNSACSYGPFNYSGTFTTDSNRRFDGWLKSRNAASGIRDFEAVRDAAVKVGNPRACSSASSRRRSLPSPRQNGFQFIADFDMPANNRLLVFVLSDSALTSPQLFRIPGQAPAL
jgi:hypothetical protein